MIGFGLAQLGSELTMLRIRPPAGEPLVRSEQFLKLASTTMRNVLVD